MRNQLPLMLLPGLMNDERVWEPLRKSLYGERVVVAAQTHTHDSIAAIAAAAIKGRVDAVASTVVEA